MIDNDPRGDAERQLEDATDRVGQLALVEEVGQSPARNRAFDGAGLTRNLQEARRILRQGKQANGGRRERP